MELKGARILLTGASGGLGQALALQLAAAGATLLLHGTREEALEALRNRLPGQHEILVADLNAPNDMAQVCAQAEAFGINVLINNAGVGSFGLLAEQDSAEVAHVLQTNLLMPVQLTQRLLPVLMAAPESAVVNIGSVFGSLPFAGFAAYSTAKAGLRGFSQALRRELADSSVRVIYVAPRAIDTRFNSPAVQGLNRDLDTHCDAPEHVAAQILRAIAGNVPETCLGFPERLFAWLNGVASGLIDRGLSSKLATIKKHASRA